MRFAVDAWDPAYGVAADENLLELASEPVECGFEVPLDEWAPRSPDPSVAPPSSVLFVDGVRRIDARIWVDDGAVSRPGVCATVAAGAVRCNGDARLVAAEIERGVFTAAANGGPIPAGPGIAYEFHPLAADTDEAIYLGVHEHMTQLEGRIAVPRSPEELVVFDGPLRGRAERYAVGYVKTQHVQYLPPEAQAVVGRLAVGQRTPLFFVGGRFPRWSFYLRLPGPIAHALSGIVRLELVGVGDAAEIAPRADQLATALPRFASQPHKDSRAPQNLYPIAGLERELRRRLGDARFLQRRLRRAAAAAA